MRRTDREVIGLENILAILDSCKVLRIGLCYDNHPYIVPMNFAYEVLNDKVYIYMHCALTGKKIDIISKNNKVCFEADCSYQTLKGEAACNWSAEFQSVTGEGSIAVLAEQVQKIHALDLLMKRYGFEGKPQYHSHGLSAVAVLQITVTGMTGKHKMKMP